MKSRFERAFTVLLGILLLVLAITAQLLRSSAGPVAGSVASYEPGGRRALELLLVESGFRAEAWGDPPGLLRPEPALLWMHRTPEPTAREAAHETADEVGHEAANEDRPEAGPAPAPSPADLGFRSPAHYRRFVERGGTLLVPHGAAARDFLVEELGLAACGEVGVPGESSAGVYTVRSEGEELEVELAEDSVLAAPREGSAARVLWAVQGGEKALAVVVAAGAGQVVLLGTDAFLDNARIGAHDHALLALRLAETFAQERRVLFDEYALGLWHPRTAIGFLASPKLFLASLHVLLLLLLLTWRSAWVREFPRDPSPLAAASPLLRARTLASLLQRANRNDLLGRFLRDGIANRLERRSPAASARVRSTAPASISGSEDLERLHARLRSIEREPV